jgi:hypothetical protein
MFCDQSQKLMTWRFNFYSEAKRSFIINDQVDCDQLIMI